eukprot:8561105-Ditylum_brightwellii.AAC.1
MNLKCIEGNLKNAQEYHSYFRKYLSLPDTVAGAYGGHYCDEIFLFFLEEMLQIQIFILRLGLPSDEDNPTALKGIPRKTSSYQRNSTE